MSDDKLEPIKLPAHFSQVQLSGLKEIVDHHHEVGQKVQFDANDVDRIDGAAVQFLLAVSRLQSSSDLETIISNTNEVVLSAFDDMGMAHLHKSATLEAKPTAEDA